MKGLFLYWHFDIALIVFTGVAGWLYFYMLQFKLVKRSAYFFFSLLIIFIATASPLYFLAMHYLFSAHMVLHVMLLLIAPPLMIIGIPPENKFEKQLKLISKRITPLISWLTGVSIMWFWHIPFIYHHFLSMKNMGTESNSIMAWHNFHLLSLWLAGMIFWWAVLTPYKQYQLRPLAGILYLATACISCSVLGLLITFAPENLYHTDQVDMYGFNDLIKNQWGISNQADQQIAGLIMWVPCCFIYLTGALLLLKKCFGEKEKVLSIQNINDLVKN